MTNRKTFPVYASAYRNSDLRSCLTHSCEIDADGFAVSVLCKRVKFESIVEDSTQGSDEAPTCPVCAARLAKR